MDSWQSGGDPCKAVPFPSAAGSLRAQDAAGLHTSGTSATTGGDFGLAELLDGGGFLEAGDLLLDGMPQIEGSESGSEALGQQGDPTRGEHGAGQVEPGVPVEQAEPVYFGRAALEEMLRAVAALEQEGFVAGAGVQDRLGQTYVLNRVEVTVQPHTGDLALRVIVHDDCTLFAAHPAEILLLPTEGHTLHQSQAESTRVLPETEAETEEKVMIAPTDAEAAAAAKRALDEDPGVLETEHSPKRRLTSPFPSEAC